MRRPPPLCVVAGDPEPLCNESDPHHDVPEHRQPEVTFVEGTGNARGKDERARDRHEDEDAVDNIVGVVGRHEPGEVHPGPPDAEEHQPVADERAGHASVRQSKVQPIGRERDRDDEHKVEEELQRRRSPVPLARIAPDHRRRKAEASGSPGQAALTHTALVSPGLRARHPRGCALTTGT